jgi:multiple sugar transport system substrate-binding protein
VTALSFMVDNLKSGIFDPASVTFNDRMVMNPFLVSDYEAMTSWGLWGWNMSNSPTESKVVGKVDVGLQYGGRASGVKSATCSGGGGLAVTKNSRNVDAAVEWLKRLSGIDHPENQIFSLEKVGNMPGTTAVWENPDVLKKMPVLAQIKEQSGYIVSRPGANVTGYQNWSNMVQEQLSAALTGQKSPKEALDAAVSRSNSDFAPIGI